MPEHQNDQEQYADLVIREATAAAEMGELGANLLFRRWATDNTGRSGALSAVKGRGRLYYPAGEAGQWDIVVEQMRPSDSLPVTEELLREPPADAVAWRVVLTQSTPMEVVLGVAEMAAAEPDIIDLAELLGEEDEGDDGPEAIDLPL